LKIETKRLLLQSKKRKEGDIVPLFITMILKSRIESIVNEALGTDEFLVEVKVGKLNHLQVFIDGADGFNIESCRRVSRAIEAKLDREEEDYKLDVSSPGLDKPFKVHQQYEKYIDRKIDLFFEDGDILDAVLKVVEDDLITVEYRENKKTVSKSYKISEIIKAKPSISFK
jgi:ribosome maturation factor RimP